MSTTGKSCVRGFIFYFHGESGFKVCDMDKLLKNVQRELGEDYETKPLSRAEGGIELCKYPGLVSSDNRKHIRFHMRRLSSHMGCHTCLHNMYAADSHLMKFEIEPEKIIWEVHYQSKFDGWVTFETETDNTPLWTKIEQKAVKEAFIHSGLRCSPINKTCSF